MKGGVWRSDFFRKELDGLRGCVNRCLEEICPAEVLLPKKWRKKFAFLSPHIERPGKAFLDQATISKPYPWAKINIKYSNRKKIGHCVKHHPLRHCQSRFFTIAHMYSMRVAHSTAVTVLGGEHHTVLGVQS